MASSQWHTSRNHDYMSFDPALPAKTAMARAQRLNQQRNNSHSASAIVCSTCSVSIDLEYLSSHFCGTRPQIRVNTEQRRPIDHPGQDTRSRDQNRNTSDSPNAGRNYSPASASSSNQAKLPFFDRYKRLVAKSDSTTTSLTTSSAPSNRPVRPLPNATPQLRRSYTELAYAAQDNLFRAPGSSISTLDASGYTNSAAPQSRTKLSSRNNRPVSGNGKVGLDACLADLELMADDVERYNRETQVRHDGREIDSFRRESGPAVLSDFIDDLSSMGSRSPVTPEFHPPGASIGKCTACQRNQYASSPTKLTGDSQLYCKSCYGDRFLPKCRKCGFAIDGGAVSSRDGKVVGKYHPACFVCYDCDEPFTDLNFYIWERNPVCKFHYHQSNGSLCRNIKCGLEKPIDKAIEGPCVSLVGESNGGGGRYHPQCFCCSEDYCRVPLLEHHFVSRGLPYCEDHESIHNQDPPPFLSKSDPSSRHGQDNSKTSRAKKRQTLITRT